MAHWLNRTWHTLRSLVSPAYRRKLAKRAQEREKKETEKRRKRIERRARQERRERAERVRQRKQRVAERVHRFEGTARFCPICGKTAAAFEIFGRRKRRDARCPWCGALERHRFAWVWLQRHSGLFDPPGKTMLHFAPEKFLQDLLQPRLGAGYVTSDLEDPQAMIQADITDLPMPAATYDAIYCSHVLEHVQDDAAAMRELHRVLKPGGFALLSIPLMAEQTIEDPTVTDPAERTRLFGQFDHVRIYGRDFKDRLQAAGFTVQVVYPQTFLSPEECERMAMTKACGEIFIARK